MAQGPHQRKTSPASQARNSRWARRAAALAYAASATALALTAQGCTGHPVPKSGTSGSQTVADQVSESQAAKGARISFHYADYYTLSDPNGSGCAGDIRTLYDPIALVTPQDHGGSLGYGGVTGVTGMSVAPGVTGPTGPLVFPPSAFAQETIKPSFIKNISVDMTDATAQTPGNLAKSCAIGASATTPPTSNCATFDYGAVGGIPTTLGGTMLVIGGVQNYNYAGYLPVGSSLAFQGVSLSCGPVTAGATGTGYTSCNSGVFALGVDTLPASAFQNNPGIMPAFAGTSGPTGPVSSWANLSGAQGYTGPVGGAGASASYDAGLQKVLLFGGAAPLAGMGSYASGVTTYDTWSLDLKSQQWSYLSANIYITNKLLTLYDTTLDIRAPAGVPGAGSGPISPFSVQIQKPVGPRAIFGYLPLPGVSLKLDQLGASTVTSAMIDATDRLMVVGGYGSLGPFFGTHRFNPTYGPEIENVIGITPFGADTAGINPGSTSGYGVGTVAATAPVQWIDSYHTQLLNNTYGRSFTNGTPLYSSLSSNFNPDLPPLGTGATGGHQVINSAFAPLVNNNAAAGGVQGAGYVLAAGGFDASTNLNVPDTTVGDTAAKAGCTMDGLNVAAPGVDPTHPYGTNTDLNCGGGLSILSRFYADKTALATSHEIDSSNFSGISNFVDANATPNTPVVWTQIPEGTNSSVTPANFVPFVGGATFLPGFNLSKNEVAYFGGVDCRAYVDDKSAPCTSYKNPGRYWQFGTNPVSTVTPASTQTVPNNMGWTAPTAPSLAGMAAARGLDPHNDTIMLAWGGSKGASTPGGFDRIYYLTNPAANQFTWAYADRSSSTVLGDVPSELINSAMVYSHVTHKFYVFGGYDPSTQLTRGDTYELSISSPGNIACTTGSCIFTWRKLNQTGAGLTCYPSSCPSARRSHRMAEVNYFNRNPGGKLSVANTYRNDGEQACAANAPCSYGIFMEGGSSDGFHYLGDRWMFDPTANGGNGHWQLMTELPPRTLASMTSVDYTTPVNGQTVHRALLFGGETGLHSPENAYSKDVFGNSAYYVPPTLGDTWIFDYDSQSWNRVELLGKGYNGWANIPGTQNLAASSEWERRQGFDATAPNTFTTHAGASVISSSNYAELSPPPLSGAIMVTRTQAPPRAGSTSTALRTLPVPEVYLFGGRLKDGTFNTLDHVYKFCMGSTGEAFSSSSAVESAPDANDYICDAYDAVNNPSSPSPVATYVGRWLRKAPNAVDTAGANAFANLKAAFMGAGAYDPVRDRIILTGGILPTVAGTAVTDTAPNHLATNVNVYEYTPPQPQLATATPASATPREGRWTQVSACTGSAVPVGRYGHTLSYDTLNQALIMVGGNGAGGVPLTTTINYPDGRTYSMPEVWKGTYCAEDNCGGKLPGVTISGSPCYYWKPITLFGNSIDIQSQVPPMTGLSNSTSIYIPATGYNTGYYAMFDNACVGAGPIATSDPSTNKLLAGGAYIDLDRSQLGANENLLLNVTYIPLGPKNVNPDATPVTPDQSAVFRVHLIKTGQSQDQLQSVLQPRYMTYAATDQYPEVAQSISVLAPPTGQVAQEQILIPLSIDAGIDRIRIERLSGSGILLEASIYRMGTK